MTRDEWKQLHRTWRLTRRNLLEPGMIAINRYCYDELRKRTGRFLSFDVHPGPRGSLSFQAVPVRTRSTGQVVYRLHGPYRCGRIGALSK